MTQDFERATRFSVVACAILEVLTLLERAMNIAGIVSEVKERGVGAGPAPLKIGLASGRSFPATKHSLNLGRKPKPQASTRSPNTTEEENMSGAAAEEGASSDEDYKQRNLDFVMSMSPEEVSE